MNCIRQKSCVVRWNLIEEYQIEKVFSYKVVTVDDTKNQQGHFCMFLLLNGGMTKKVLSSWPHID